MQLLEYVLPLARLAAWKIVKEYSALEKTPATVKEANYTLLSCFVLRKGFISGSFHQIGAFSTWKKRKIKKVRQFLFFISINEDTLKWQETIVPSLAM